MSDETLSVVQAVNAVQADLEAVAKAGERTGSVRFNYRRIDDVVAALHPLLAKHGVVIVPKVRNHATVDATVDSGRSGWTMTTLHVRYRVYGPAGDYITVDAVGEGMDNSDKGVGKAASYAYKTFISQLFSIPTHDPANDVEATEAPRAEPWWRPLGWNLKREHDAARAQLVDRMNRLPDGAEKDTIRAHLTAQGFIVEGRLVQHLSKKAQADIRSQLDDALDTLEVDPFLDQQETALEHTMPDGPDLTDDK